MPTLTFSCTPENTHGPSGLACPGLPEPLCPARAFGLSTEVELADLTTPSLRSGIPLATSPLESGSPRVSTPGTCRPCAFSALRRFPPPVGLLALFHASATYGIQRAWTISPGVCSVSRRVPALRPARQLAAPKRNLESERGTLLSTGVSSSEVTTCCALACVPFWTAIDLPSQASCHSPIAPRTKRRGGGPNEDQSTSATQMALSYASLGSMWPYHPSSPEGASELSNQNQVTGPDRWPCPMRHSALCGPSARRLPKELPNFRTRTK